ncbi:MAG: TetR/AcrR family transcriptional regulator [Geobacteraceae bacterium]|nr:TetR/AcrR family transcriptional regulator [Geobacteraceae bacterium]
MNAKGNSTRQEIVKKSLELFSVKGYFNTSIGDIMAATGLTKGGLYGHFGSKEAIWDACYEEAVRIWTEIVFKDVTAIDDPLERLLKVIENDMGDYLGGNIFPGGCFFLNMIVELSGQAEHMKNRIWQGFEGFGKRMSTWLGEAETKGLIRSGLDHGEISGFVIIVLNGAAALYAVTKDPLVWQRTVRQLRAYLEQLRV